MRRPLLVRGGTAVISEQELRGSPARPGLVIRVERGGYGFEVMVLSSVPADGDSSEQLFQGRILDVWGRIPCV